MDIVVVQLTGRGVGAIAVVLVAGAGVREFLAPDAGERAGAGDGGWGDCIVCCWIRRGVAIDDIVVAGGGGAV